MAISKCITGLQHLGLPTNDMEATKAFYEGIGFKPIYETMNGKERVIFFEQKGLVVEAYQNGQAAMKHGAWDHVAIDVNDIEAAFDEAKKAGLKLLDSEINFLPFFKNGVKFFTVLGPNGEKVEFNQML